MIGKGIDPDQQDRPAAPAPGPKKRVNPGTEEIDPRDREIKSDSKYKNAEPSPATLKIRKEDEAEKEQVK